MLLGRDGSIRTDESRETAKTTTLNVRDFHISKYD